jgi:pimeloyl-ACP methyl ester carboxylesterase
VPETRYAKSDGLNIAYQTVGEGPPDLVYVPGWVTNVEVVWEEPVLAEFLRRLSSFARLVFFDKRGIGLSDPVPIGELPDMDTRVRDLQAVMDAAGIERANLFGHSEGGATAMSFAARYPERTERLIVFGGYAKRLWSEEYPWAPTLEERESQSADFERTWADPSSIADYYAPSRADDEAFTRWVGRWLRLSASPRAAAALNDASSHIDVIDELGDIRAPTLLLYRLEESDVNIEEGRFIASRIPGSRLVELHGRDHFFYAGDTEPILQEIEEFVTGHRGSTVPERVVTTVVFTDIVDSTETASALGLQGWRNLLHRHDTAVDDELVRWQGQKVKSTGDGVMATFTSPTQAISFAKALPSALSPLGIEVRCGVHTGEVEIRDHDLAGLAVHIAARICDLADPSEVLVSRTVKDLVAGTGVELHDRGTHALKGLSEEWQVHSVE